MESSKFEDIPIEQIEVLPELNSRIEKEDLSELMNSIKEIGLLQPIGVYKTGEKKYTICFGYRRLEAHKLLEKKTIPAIIYDELTESSALVKNITENLIRRDLSSAEYGSAIARLKEHGLSERAISVVLGLPVATIKSYSNIYNLAPRLWQERVKARGKKNKAVGLGTDVASMIAVNGNLNKEEQNKLFELAEREDLTVEETRLIIYLMRVMTFDEAVKERLNYKHVMMHIIVRKTVYEDIIESIPFTNWVYQLLKRERPALVPFKIGRKKNSFKELKKFYQKG